MGLKSKVKFVNLNVMKHIHFILAASAAFLINSAVSEAGNLRPTELTCEYAVNPEVIDVTTPRLSWINESDVNGECQTAWQIRVSSDRRHMRRGDLWKSGKVASDQSVLVRYAGTPLQSRQQCWWQVRVWDSKGHRSRWSEPARWGMGLLDKDDWQAQWIGSPWQGEEGKDAFEDRPYTPAPLLRKSFEINKKVKSAKAYVTGLGLFRFYVNGQKMGNEELTPNETSYTHRPDLVNCYLPLDDTRFRGFKVFYLCYDITDLLTRGENVIGAMLGCGFYDVDSNWVISYGSPRFIGQVEIEYADGTVDTIVSDGSWLAHNGPITHDSMYDGEFYDARLEQPGWNAPGAVLDDGWQPAAMRKAPDGELRAHFYTSDRVMEEFEPKSITALEDGSLELDFGDYLTGWLHFRHIDAAPGDSIKVEYLCESAGNGPGIYVAKGTGDEEYSASFTWFCFDKVRISGYPGELLPENVTAEAVYADVEKTGSFACSNPLFEQIDHIWWRAQTDNMHMGVPTDCPQREKGPYTGDGELACVTVMHNFDARAFYTKWIRDMIDCQDVETGYVPNGAPWHPGCGGGVGWGAAMNIVPWEFYVHYGDRDILEECWFPMTEQLRHMRSWLKPDGTMHQQISHDGEVVYFYNLGDWLPPFENPADELVHTYLLWKCTDITAKAAAALGKTAEAAEYRAQAQEVADAFNRVFYDPANKTYGDYGSNVIALKLGVPDDRKADVLQTLQQEIARYGGHLNTGIVGTSVFFEMLAENGLNELAYEAMNKRDFPSFGWWLEQGAYTTWEAWNGENSHCHPMFGSALTWLYRNVAGMREDESQPGYRHIIFSPMPCGGLTWAEYYNRTPYGRAGIHWELADGAMHAKITVPVGCTATVNLPQPDGTVSTTEVGSGVFEF